MTCSDCVADIDECTLGTHDCGPEFTCTNTAGSFRCHPKETCSTGFIQDAAGSCMGQSGLFFIDYKSEEFCSLLRFCFIRYKRVRGQRQSLPCWPHLYQHTGFLHLSQEHSLLRERLSSAWERHALWRSVLVQTSGDFWRVVSEMSLFFTLLS